MVTLITAFAVGTVAHAASNTAMSFKMAVGVGDAIHMDMSDCQCCGSDDGGQQDGQDCDIVCVSSFLADISGDANTPLVTGLSISDRSFYDLAGRTSLPEPYPPRTLI